MPTDATHAGLLTASASGVGAGLAPVTAVALILAVFVGAGIAADAYAITHKKKRPSRVFRWSYEELRKAFQARERDLLTPRLRADILQRDKSRCQRCGTTAAEGAVLHIDHIVPISRGGLTVPDNLQTLCAACNLGKSNRFVG